LLRADKKSTAEVRSMDTWSMAVQFACRAPWDTSRPQKSSTGWPRELFARKILAPFGNFVAGFCCEIAGCVQTQPFVAAYINRRMLASAIALYK
jgi:hypothetical protein